jgi:hypothetical protein
MGIWCRNRRRCGGYFPQAASFFKSLREESAEGQALLVTATREDSTRLESVEAETERIMRTGTIWLAMVVIAAALVLGPSFAAGWHPGVMRQPLETAWWFGAVVASAGTALLVWAACPVLGFPLAEAHRQKVFSIRVGIVLSLSGLVISGGVALLAPGA